MKIISGIVYGAGFIRLLILVPALVKAIIAFFKKAFGKAPVDMETPLVQLFMPLLSLQFCPSKDDDKWLPISTWIFLFAADLIGGFSASVILWQEFINDWLPTFGR